MRGARQPRRVCVHGPSLSFPSSFPPPLPSPSSPFSLFLLPPRPFARRPLLPLPRASPSTISPGADRRSLPCRHPRRHRCRCLVQVGQGLVAALERVGPGQEDAGRHRPVPRREGGSGVGRRQVARRRPQLRRTGHGAVHRRPQARLPALQPRPDLCVLLAPSLCATTTSC